MPEQSWAAWLRRALHRTEKDTFPPNLFMQPLVQLPNPPGADKSYRLTIHDHAVTIQAQLVLLNELMKALSTIPIDKRTKIIFADQYLKRAEMLAKLADQLKDVTHA